MIVVCLVGLVKSSTQRALHTRRQVVAWDARYMHRETSASGSHHLDPNDILPVQQQELVLHGEHTVHRSNSGFFRGPGGMRATFVELENW